MGSRARHIRGDRPTFRQEVDAIVGKLQGCDQAALQELRNSRGNLDFLHVGYEFSCPLDVAREAIWRFNNRGNGRSP